MSYADDDLRAVIWLLIALVVLVAIVNNFPEFFHHLFGFMTCGPKWS
jgi:uncharacterized membrane protein